ncbi:MAG: hypothetical protein GWM98_05895, partial [Nitrospinaceae bacterium]|nr:hypothetical protein [Nitrospinaceae bacterium]NIR54089.1 hypothetical protein [Nitrospinaceae bacterium]NIS84507.1 hypothetical protein [Nitrospinaceae bacterium]NIT81302.1 hypothetical protein [Nitrospinaceae bacterium]NIU43589.1 hypothetical protein [Nitrospinaceae bacterium]
LNRKVEESNLQKFLSDTVTLLSVINDRLAKEPHIVMARTEETTIPLQTRNEM